jgi:PAS domain S-box-containing protein
MNYLAYPKFRITKLLADARVNPTTPQSLFIRYGIACIGVGIASLISISARPIFEPNPFLLFLVVVALVIWYAGFWPGMVAAALSLVSANYLLISNYSFQIEPVDFARLVLFGTVTLIMSWPFVSLRRTEAHLRIAEARLQAALKGSPVAVYNQDLDLRYTWIQNPQLDLTPEQVKGLRSTDIMSDPQDAKMVDDLKRQVIATGIGTRQEVSFHTGAVLQVFDLTIEPLYDITGQIVGVTCASMDMTEQKLAEKALRESEERFRLVTEKALVGVYIIQEGKTVYVNPRMAEIFGYEPQEMIGITPAELVHPNEFDRTMERYRLRTEQDEFHFSGQGIRKDGGTVFYEVMSRQVEYRGQPAIIGTLLDLTKRKQAQAKADQERLRLQTVLKALPVGVSITDANGRMIEMNEQVARIWGAAPLSTTIDEYTAYKAWWADTGEPVTAETWALTRALQKGEVSVGEVLHIERFDGTHGTILNNAAPIYDSDGQLLGAVAALMDITERVRIEEALRISEERFQTAIKNSPVAVVNQDNDLRYTWIYNSARGVDINSVFGKRDEDMLERAEDATRLSAIKRRVLDTGIGAREEVSVYHGGIPYFYDLTVEPLRSAQGQIIGITCASIDITERKKAEAEIHALNTELEKRVAERTAQLVAVNQELEAFSYSVSHDLRTPLRAINGFSLALLEDYADRLDDEGKYFLERVRLASERMGQLIDILLDLSRVTRSTMQLGTVYLSDMASLIVREFQELDPDRHVTVKIQEGLVAAGDRRLLEVLLQNLLNNAWKFTSKLESACIEFGMVDQDGNKVYFVRDNGVGFDMAYVNKLFGAFQRLHHLSEFEGIGIGLATVQRIVHRHGGQVWAEGVPNQGATFYFTLAS